MGIEKNSEIPLSYRRPTSSKGQSIKMENLEMGLVVQTLKSVSPDHRNEEEEEEERLIGCAV